VVFERSKTEIMDKIDEFCLNNGISDDFGWLRDSDSYRFTFFRATPSPTAIHIFGGNHLFRFFSHWIYKSGFINKFCMDTIPDWLLSAMNE